MVKKILAFLKTSRNRMLHTDEQIVKVRQSDRVPTILFLFAVFFYVAYQMAMQSSWVFGGEMWAEMATNYFPNANAASYFQKIFATDAGYIPLPQRLIALVGNVFNFPASAIPYFYTWSAILLTGMMIGTFCLAQFRTLVKSDALRFLTAIVILVVADFETRTFVNFTYFAAFFIAITTALALSEDSKEVPRWAWFIPILIVSKPAVISVLPAMIIVAIIRKSRFRWITIVAVALFIGQALQLILSHQSGMMPQASEITFLSKAIASIKYFFGLLGGYSVGKNFHLNGSLSIAAGLLVFVAGGIIAFKKMNGASNTIIIGLSLILFNVLINCFALSDDWNRDMSKLAALPVYRHIIVGFFGCILVVVGLVASITESKLSRKIFANAVDSGSLIFVVWFACSGWLLFGAQISKQPGFPWLNNSQWQKMALAIDSGATPLCVPIDPLGWMYSRDCTLLYPQVNWTKGFRFETTESIGNSGTVEILPPTSLSANTLISLAVLARPLSMQTSFVEAKAIINLKDGSKKYYTGGRDLTFSGGLILLTGRDQLPINNISSVRFNFSSPVEIAITSEDKINLPSVLWMGH